MLCVDVSSSCRKVCFMLTVFLFPMVEKGKFRCHFPAGGISAK